MVPGNLAGVYVPDYHIEPVVAPSWNDEASRYRTTSLIRPSALTM